MDELTKKHCQATLEELDDLDEASRRIAAQRLLAFVEAKDFAVTEEQHQTLRAIAQEGV